MTTHYLWKIILSNIIFSFPVNLSSGSKNVFCSSIGFCKCGFPNGRGVDLTLLKGLISAPVTNDEFLLFYPCKDTNVTNGTIKGTVSLNECEVGVSLCLQKRNGNDSKLFNLGKLSESHFNWMNIAYNPVLTFHHVNWTTNIELICSGSKQSTVENVSKHNNNIYDLVLSSENFCITNISDEGQSVLSTFFLILLVFFLFYLCFGFFVLRFIRGAQGWEAIPNGEFWRSGWFSFKKMCMYFMNGCRHPEAYDTI